MNKIPETLTIEIENRSRKKVFRVGCLNKQTCEILNSLFGKIEPEILDSDTAKRTSFELVETNRKVLSMILAVAIENYKGTYSKKVARFIGQSTTAKELLALTYLIKKQAALFTANHYLDEVQTEQIGLELRQQFETEAAQLNNLFQEHQKKEAEAIEQVNQLWKGEQERLRASIKEGMKHCTNLRIIHYEI
jgi:hypothetical protein